MNRNSHRKIRSVLVSLVVINLLLAGALQEGLAGEASSADSSNQCVRRDGLTFNGVGLWTRLPAVLKQYGQPLHVEPMDSHNPNRVYAYYTYKDVKLLIFSSIVYQIEILTADISSHSGIRLLSDFSTVQTMLGVQLRNSYRGPNGNDTYKIPICPPDPPEVEEYVKVGFDQSRRLVEFAVMGIFP